MQNLVTEIAGYMAVSALLGLLLGYLIWGMARGRRRREGTDRAPPGAKTGPSEADRERIAKLERERDQLETRLGQLSHQIVGLSRERDAALAERPKPAATDPTEPLRRLSDVSLRRGALDDDPEEPVRDDPVEGEEPLRRRFVRNVTGDGDTADEDDQPTSDDPDERKTGVRPLRKPGNRRSIFKPDAGGSGGSPTRHIGSDEDQSAIRLRKPTRPDAAPIDDPLPDRSGNGLELRADGERGSKAGIAVKPRDGGSERRAAKDAASVRPGRSVGGNGPARFEPDRLPAESPELADAPVPASGTASRTEGGEDNVAGSPAQTIQSDPDALADGGTPEMVPSEIPDPTKSDHVDLDEYIDESGPSQLQKAVENLREELEPMRNGAAAEGAALRDTAAAGGSTSKSIASAEPVAHEATPDGGQANSPKSDDKDREDAQAGPMTAGLSRVKGIGEKTEARLNAAGVVQIRDLAELSDKGVRELAVKLGATRARVAQWVERARQL